MCIRDSVIQADQRKTFVCVFLTLWQHSVGAVLKLCSGCKLLVLWLIYFILLAAVLYCYIAIWFSLSVCENRRFNQTLSNSIEVEIEASLFWDCTVICLYPIIFANWQYQTTTSIHALDILLNIQPSLHATPGYKRVDYYRHPQWLRTANLL